MKYFLGIDVGTSSLKTGLWREDGELAASASCSYATHRPSATWAEQNPLDWWKALRETVQEILHTSKASPQQIAAIGIDSTGWTFVPVNQAGDPLYAAMLWQDRRAVVEAQALRASTFGERLIQLSANPLDEAYTTAKIHWLHAHHPDVYQQADQFLFSSGFLIRKLTGHNTCDYTQAYGLHCFDVRALCWDADAALDLGIDIAKLPPLFQSCVVVGEVTTSAGREIGLVAGIPVIAGGLDAAVGAFGSGVTRTGQTADQGGTAFGLSIAVDQVVVEPRLIFSPHVVPELFLLQGGTVGGGTFNWFRQEFGHAEQMAADLLGGDVYTMMTDEANQSPPGANGLLFLPYLAGERSPIWDSNARGVFCGLSYTTKRSDVLRALMEGCVFAVYHNMQVAASAGAHVNEWIGIGGAANSPSWCQIKADITNRPFTVTRRSNNQQGDNTLGLAVMAGYGIGHYSNLAETMDQFLPNRFSYQPNAANHIRYQELFMIYERLYQQLTPTFSDLASFIASKAQ